jgi:flagellar biosynthesis chaperone FliJ
MTLAVRDREALDHFYDKSRRAHAREAHREEQKTIDELAVQLNSTPGPLQFTGQKN